MKEIVIRYVVKLVQVLSFLLMILGASMMDSEDMAIPIMFTLIGGVVLSFSCFIEAQYVEF